MFALLLFQAAPETAPKTAIDAERAFNHAAQTQGQWTAFRAFMAPGATVFTPQPAKAVEVLPVKNPPIAVQWWPAGSYVSCDGTVAVNTGPWVRPDSLGYFTTVWVKQPDGQWKWLVDHGDALPTPRPLPEQPRVHRASCARQAGPVSKENAEGEAEPVVMITRIPLGPSTKSRGGASPDETLRWSWAVRPDGARVFDVELWSGREFETVVHDEVSAAK